MNDSHLRSLKSGIVRGMGHTCDSVDFDRCPQHFFCDSKAKNKTEYFFRLERMRTVNVGAHYYFNEYVRIRLYKADKRGLLTLIRRSKAMSDRF